MPHCTLIGPGALLALVAQAGLLHAQPGTDIYVGDLSHSGGRVSVSGLINATDRDGYDNQPHFGPNGAFVLYTSGRPDGQTDIYRYDIQSQRNVAVTNTPESEYSPTMMPGDLTFSVIRVEADSSQRLWAFDLNGQGARLLFQEIMPVGYHAWGDDVTVALFVLGSPPTLQVADTRTGQARILERNIGRSIHRIPGDDAISFVHKVSDEEWWIRRLDLRTEEFTSLVQTLPGSEDYAWATPQTLMMGQNSFLYQWSVGSGGSWTEVADLAPMGVKSITRIAVSRDGRRIAVVGNRE